MAALELLQNLSNSLADAAEAVGKAVVRVDDNSRFTASGLIWSEDHVVATSHGVEADEGLSVVLHDGRKLEAHLVGRDDGSDIAVLRVSEKLIPPAKAAGARAGEIVLAAGRPGERGLQVTMGIISSVQQRAAGNLYYTDATLAPGFSGGALINTNGEIIGMVNLWSRRRSGVAIGAGLVAEAVDAILGGGAVQRGYLGVRAQTVELPRDKYAQGVGLLLAGIEDDSAAEKAGLLLGDVLLAVNGSTLNDVEGLSAILRSTRAGNTVRLKVLRAGSILELDAKLLAYP